MTMILSHNVLERSNLYTAHYNTCHSGGTALSANECLHSSVRF